MKTVKHDKRSRGYISKKDMDEYYKLSDTTLFNYLSDEEGINRTGAIRVLSDRGFLSHPDFEYKLLEMIQNEPCLYTRLEIAKALQKGNEETVKLLIRYLGVIVNHQYKELPKRPSKKKSYPLPRDIIARILSKMDPNILPYLFEVLYSEQESKISEVLDAIGFILFYHPDYATSSYEEGIMGIMEKYKKKNRVIYWKCIQCLSAFSSDKVEAFLLKLRQENMGLLQEEAKRSYHLIQERKNYGVSYIRNSQ